MLGALVSRSRGVAEAEHAVVLLQSVPQATGTVTVGGDKGSDTAPFVNGARAIGTVPHVAP